MMSQWVLVLGVVVSIVSGWLWIRPTAMAGLLNKVFGSRWLYAAALLRLLLGASLIAAADAVAYSQVVALLGWLMALGALVLVVVPAPAVAQMAAWFGRLSPAMSRLWLSTAVLFGLFLTYAALA
jgi:hypothetical protein